MQLRMLSKDAENSLDIDLEVLSENSHSNAVESIETKHLKSAFIDKIVATGSITSHTIEQLNSTVKNFETQFA